MEYFLERIARSLRDEFGESLNRHCLVFPGRRAGLYMLKYLSRNLDRPVWAPTTCTINELFRKFSDMQVASAEMLLFELYRSYLSLRKDAGSFDDFYFWGDMLLNDFDDTDKYIADAAQLFGNVKDLREIDARFGSLTEEQAAIIRRFWLNFEISKPTDQKSGFISLWSVMNDLYAGFRKALREQNLGYEGMIFRDVAERNGSELSGSFPSDIVHFIGFNALNNCEKRLMTALKNEGKARFYWDYDSSFIENGNHNSAGFFMTENLKLFGNDMPADWNYNTLISSVGAKRTVIETSSDITQVKLVPEFLSKLEDLNSSNAHHTAIVLSDETLLVPLLSSLPGDTTDINITMGYPLRQTLVFTLVRDMMDLQRSAREHNGSSLFYSPGVLNILRHPLISCTLDDADINLIESFRSANKAWLTADDFVSSGLMARIFSRHHDPLKLSAWFRDVLSIIAGKQLEDEDQSETNIRNEFIYRVVLSLNRLESILVNSDFKLSSETYLKLLERLLRSQAVPFSGEPLSGIQVMGILETRALDFRNLIILSVNEGVMPALSSSASFIPFSLRQAFGLPSVNHQESIYAYHFYRLLQRAENVILCYNSNSEGLRSGEMSRFLTQMNFNKVLKPEFRNVGFEIRTPGVQPSSLPRTEEHIRLLNERFLAGKGRVLSPSAMNTWLNCRMKFFYRYIKDIAEPEVPAEDIDPAIFGNILHTLMKQLYAGYTGKTISPAVLEDISRNDALLHNTISSSIQKEFRDGAEVPVTGNELIVREVLHTYVKRILLSDKSIAPFTMLHLEEYFDFSIAVPADKGEIHVRTGGYADRIDRINGITRIVDYKTGFVGEFICSVDDLFEEDRMKESDGWLQVLLYCEAWYRKNPGSTVIPSIYKIKKMTGKPFNDRLVIREGKTDNLIDDYRDIRDQFVSGISELIAKIFSKDEPFNMTEELSKCRYCPYNVLCSR